MPIRHEIKQGESVIGLSERYGLFVDTIWDDPANAELKRKRGNMNILMPGDVVVIPDKRPKEVSRETNSLHKFRRKGLPALFRLQLFDVEKPRADQSYTLEVDGRQYEGRTDSRGVLEKNIPANAKKGLLVIGPDRYRLEISFGHLDPIGEISGIKKRLNNMGYDCGAPNNQSDDRLRDRLKLFQKRFGLEQTGEPDAPTLLKLEEFHDRPVDFPPAPGPTATEG